MKRAVFIVVLVVLGIALGLGVAVYVIDLHTDREAVITVTGPVRVYNSESPPGYIRGDEGVVEFLHEGDPTPRVLRIYDENGVEAIHVRLGDGREGYIFCCDNFVLSR